VYKSRQTAVVKLGGSGRPIIGKFKIRNPDGEIESADEFRYAFFTSMTDPGAKTKEELKALRKQRENTFTNFHIRPVQCAKDGSFRIDQVEPGKYALLVETSATAMTTTHRLLFTGEREVEIPASDPKMREPLDLGLIEVSLRSPSRSYQ